MHEKLLIHITHFGHYNKAIPVMKDLSSWSMPRSQYTKQYYNVEDFPQSSKHHQWPWHGFKKNIRRKCRDPSNIDNQPDDKTGHMPFTEKTVVSDNTLMFIATVAFMAERQKSFGIRAKGKGTIGFDG